MWQQEGEGPGSWQAARPAPLPQPAPRPGQGAPARGWVLAAGAEHTAPGPALLPLPSSSPVSSLCVHSPLAQALLGHWHPLGPFIATRTGTRPLCCHSLCAVTAPVLSQPSPTHHPQPGSGNSSWPWVPKAPQTPSADPALGNLGTPELLFTKQAQVPTHITLVKYRFE